MTEFINTEDVFTHSKHTAAAEQRCEHGQHQYEPEDRLCMLVLSRLARSCLPYNSAHYLTTELWHLSLSFKPWLWIYRQPQSTTDNELHIRGCANKLSVTVTEHLRHSAYNERKGSQMWGFSSMVFWACSGWQKLLRHRQRKRGGQSLNIPLRARPWWPNFLARGPSASQ